MNENELNIVINNKFNESEKDLIPILFNNEKVLEVDENFTIYDALILLNIFKSKSQARKNWNKGIIEKGYQEFTQIGKLNKGIFIWNPINTKG